MGHSKGGDRRRVSIPGHGEKHGRHRNAKGKSRATQSISGAPSRYAGFEDDSVESEAWDNSRKVLITCGIMLRGIITLSATFEQVGVGITAGEKGKDKNKVVVVASVDAGSPAAKSQKIFVDDSIISIDHIQVSSAKQAHECLQVNQ
jgi:hypothetical protein